MKKKLCIFVLYGLTGASSKYRILQYIESLNQYFEISTNYFWGNKYIEKYIKNKKRYIFPIFFLYIIGAIKRLYYIFFVAKYCDVVFIQKTLIPKMKPIGISYLKKKGVKIVFDIDDAMYVYRMDNTDDIAKLSDVVVCGNENLYEHYKLHCKNCEIIPTVVDTKEYSDEWKDTFDNKIVGWIGSNSTIRNLDVIVTPFNRVVERHPEVTFLIISDTPLAYTEKIMNCQFVKWNLSSFIKSLATISIGIMPLIDDEFNNGKCGFKLIQYMNLKKPVIASDVGINRTIVGDNGFLANNDHDWEDRLETLLFDKEIYCKKRTNIENCFFDNYSYSAVSRRIINILII